MIYGTKERGEIDHTPHGWDGTEESMLGQCSLFGMIHLGNARSTSNPNDSDGRMGGRSDGERKRSQ